jgi:hypothetical protein
MSAVTLATIVVFPKSGSELKFCVAGADKKTMREWKHTIKGVRPLLNAFELGASSAENLHAVHAIISKRSCFADFEGLEDMEFFEDSGDAHEDMEVANGLLEEMWDYADANDIWIDPS